jgi:transmembrane sensor
MERQRFLNLLDKYTSGQATRQEQNLLEEYYKRLDTLSELELTEQEEETFQQTILQNIRTRIAIDEQEIKLISRRSYRIWYVAAASVLLILGIGGYFYSGKTGPAAPQITKTPANDISPGSNRAILTLSNGKEIVLTGAADGILASQDATKIIKKANGELAYKVEDEAEGPDLQLTYNTITIPRGGQYQVILPDGSKVLLNSASSLTYPIQFKGRQRSVTLKGEAYFEVAKNKTMPFVVTANDVEVRVLGTHFNISAYGDDATTTTTLLEGAVRINKGKTTALLNPGQQGIAKTNLSTVSIQNANIEEVMGWTKGHFVFADLSIKEVMKIAGRWYDIDVEYRGNVQAKKFGGTTSRYSNITELLDYMKITGGVNYKIEGRRVILMN